MKYARINIRGEALFRQFRTPFCYWCFICAIILFALLIRCNVAIKHCIAEGDEGAWLRLAVQFPGKEFMTSKVIEHDLYFERKLPHPEDNRSPLYPILIALFRPVISDTFRAGQVLNLCICGIFMVIIAVGMHNAFGPVATISTLLFFTASPFLIVYSAHIYPDMLVALGFFVFVNRADRIFKSIRNVVLSGIAFGLLFLLKTTAIFLIPVFVYAWWKLRSEKGVVRKSIIFSLISLVLALPWMIRNYLAFGSPLFQVSKFTLYMESFKNHFDVYLGIPSLSKYLSQFGVFHVFVARPFLGLLEMIKMFPWFDHNLSLALLPLCIAGGFALRGKKELYKPILWFSLFYLPFMAYIAYNSWVARYIMVYYVFIYCLAGVGIAFIRENVKKTAVRYSLVIAQLCLALCTVVYPLEFYLSGRGNECYEDRLNRKAVEETVKRVPKSAVVLSTFLWKYYFLHDLLVVNAINFKTVEWLEKFIDIYNISYVLTKENESGLWKLLHDPKKNFKLKALWRLDTIILYKLES